MTRPITAQDRYELLVKDAARDYRAAEQNAFYQYNMKGEPALRVYAACVDLSLVVFSTIVRFDPTLVDAANKSHCAFCDGVYKVYMARLEIPRIVYQKETERAAEENMRRQRLAHQQLHSDLDRPS